MQKKKKKCQKIFSLYDAYQWTVRIYCMHIMKSLVRIKVLLWYLNGFISLKYTQINTQSWRKEGELFKQEANLEMGDTN